MQTKHTMFMEISNELMDEYKNCMKIRKKTLYINQQMRKRVRLLNAFFLFLILGAGFAYYKPKYVSGFYGEELENRVQTEYMNIVSQGWKNKNEIDSYLQEYRYQKSFSYLMLGDHIYKIDEIHNLLKEHVIWRIAYIPISSLIPLGNRMIQTCMSMLVFLEDSGNGVFRIEHIGNVLGNAVWIASLHIIYWILIKFYYLCRSPNMINNNQDAKQEMIESPKWIYIVNTEDYDGPKVILFEEMIRIVNNPIKVDTLPFLYSTLFPFDFLWSANYKPYDDYLHT